MAKKKKPKPKNTKVTSKRVATIAGRELADRTTPKEFRPPIASAMAQAEGKKKTKKSKRSK
jgi:hypothetical protein